MNCLFKFWTLVLAGLLCISCTNDHHASPFLAKPQLPRPASKEVQNLAGKSETEVLQIKYKKVDFICQMWNQYGLQLDKTLKPNHKIIWDLRQGLPKAELILESLGDPDQLFVVVLKLKELSIRDFNFQDTEGHQYKIQYSPVVSFSYDSWAQYNTTENVLDTESHGNYQDTLEIRERFIDTIMNSTSGLLEAYQKRFFQVECWIDTEIHLEYEHQFSIEKAHLSSLHLTFD